VIILNDIMSDIIMYSCYSHQALLLLLLSSLLLSLIFLHGRLLIQYCVSKKMDK